MDLHSHPIIRPLRILEGFDVSKNDTDPRGLPVLGTDNKVAGTVVDMWVDTSEMMFRFIEVEFSLENGGRRILLLVPFARIKSDGVKALNIYAAQLANVPATKSEVISKDNSTYITSGQDRASDCYRDTHRNHVRVSRSPGQARHTAQPAVLHH